MAFERWFAWRVTWRLLALALAAAGVVWALLPAPLPATAAVLAAAAALLMASLLAEVKRTNLEVARLLNALRHQDYSAAFGRAANDAGFAELGTALEQLLLQQREASVALRAQHNHIANLLEQVPTPLLAVDDHEQVDLLNHAARRLFDRPHGRRLADLSVYGEALVDGLRRRVASQQLEMRPADDAAVRLRMTQAEVVHQGRPQRLIALQPVQPDIDAAERVLSEALVRVLTHEVMNSLTPVTSLARTAASLAASLAATLPANDSAAALQAGSATVARRAEGLMQFVDRYRQVTRSPAVHQSSVAASALTEHLSQLFHAEWASAGVALVVQVQPADLVLQADRTLIDQVLMNLLRNAAQAAAAHTASPMVWLRLSRAHSGRTLIDIEDNGPGIAPAQRGEVFLPFFTTKPEGHGVGLSLARQIVLAHGGSIRVEDGAAGGACLRLVL